MLKPLALNELATSRPELQMPDLSLTIRELEAQLRKPDLKSYALTPIHSDARVMSQRSVFTVHVNTFEPLDRDLGGELTESGHLGFVDIPEACKREALQFLRRNGVHEFALFPDLGGLSRHVMQLVIPPGQR